MKKCSRKTCTIHRLQDDAEFLDKSGRECATCKTCREKKMAWDRAREAARVSLEAASRNPEMDRYFAAMVIRRGDNRPDFLAAKIVNNG